MSDKPISDDATKGIANALRSVADDIEQTKTYGEFELQNDIEEIPGKITVSHRVVGTKYTADVESKRFKVSFDWYDKEPSKDE